MSKSRRLSSASAQCPPLRIEWRPSRQAALALWLLGVLAPFSLLASGIPPRWALALALPCWIAGVRMTCRYAGLSPLALVVPVGSQPVLRDGEPVAGFEVHWRGPMAFARWRQGGKRRRIAFFPDSLDASARRALKLAMERRRDAAGPPIAAA